MNSLHVTYCSTHREYVPGIQDMGLKLKIILVFYVQSSYGECIHYEIWVIIVLQNDYIHKIPFPAN